MTAEKKERMQVLIEPSLRREIEELAVAEKGGVVLPMIRTLLREAIAARKAKQEPGQLSKRAQALVEATRDATIPAGAETESLARRYANTITISQADLEPQPDILGEIYEANLAAAREGQGQRHSESLEESRGFAMRDHYPLPFKEPTPFLDAARDGTIRF